MGSCCSKAEEPQTQQGKAETKTTTTTTRAAPAFVDKSLAFFDAPADPKELESIRNQFRGTIYYDALDSSSLEQEEQEEEPSFRYAPAQVANPHPRATVVFDHGETLLKHAGPDSQAQAAAATAGITTKEQLMKTKAVMQGLQEPTISVSLEGYPGDLTPSELEACLDFRKRLKEKDPAYRDMVLALSPTEEEPYAICRFMRSRKFDVDAVFAMLDEKGSIDKWKKNAGCYDSVETAIGQSSAVFNTQFPQVYSGMANNGTVASFIRVGRMSLEGMSCVAKTDSLSNFMWFYFQKRLPAQVDNLQRANPEVVVRCEEMYIVDLNHLTNAQISSAFMETLKNMFSPSDCFPEILNKAVLLNAPGFFSFAWRIIKMFLETRTAYKVEIFSDAAKGHARLAELLDPAFIPSDYGGQAPAFDSLAQSSYCGEGKRMEHRLLSTTKRNSTANWSFGLRDGERAVVDVYTQCKSETHFTVHHPGTGATTQAKVVPQTSGSYKPTTIVSDLEGPGSSIKVTVQADDVGHFLVIAHITLS